MEDKKQNTDKRLILEVVGLILLACCLVVTSAALAYRAVSVEDNLFRTGTVAINLNDGKPVIAAHEVLFEPGMTVEKTFFIQNRSTWDVYYRLYLSEVAGGLAAHMQITIKEGESVLYSGLAEDLTRDNALATDEVLKLHETKRLTICFHLPAQTGNSTENQMLTFTLCADAVQTQNNPNKQFG